MRLPSSPRIQLLARVAFAVTAVVALTGARTPQAKGSPRTSTRTPTPAAQPKREAVVPFAPGETLEYDISWGSALTAATATVSVREKRPSYDSTAYYIVAEGRPTPFFNALYPVYYKADTLLDSYTLLPQRGSLFSQEGHRRRMREVRFDQRARVAHVQVTTATVLRRDIKIPPDAQDLVSALYLVRTLALRQGLSVKMPVVSEADHLYLVQVTVAQRESVTTPAGTFPAWRMTPAILNADADVRGQSFTLWLSDDGRRLPLKMEAQMPIGRFVLTLRTASSGERSSR